MKKAIFTLLISLLFGLMSLSCTASEIEIKPDAVLIDVRTIQEWNTGHLESAIFLPVAQFPGSIERIVPDKSQQVILYCKSGVRARKMMKLMQNLGYDNVLNAKSVKGASKLLDMNVVQ